MPNSISQKFDRVCDILERHSYSEKKLIPILQEIQEEYNYLPEDIMTYISTALDIPAARIYGVATFYSHFTLAPKGKHIIKICDGTACHVKKSEDIIKALEKELGLSKTQRTTNDLMFTLELVACLGACGLAPAVVLDDHVHGMMTPAGTIELLNEIRNEEANSAKN